MKKTKSKNKRLISKIVTVVCLVATLVAIMVVPSFAYTIDENTGAYASQAFNYTLSRSTPNGYTVSYSDCSYLFEEHVTYCFEIPISQIDNYPSVAITIQAQNGYKFNNMYLGSFTAVDKDFYYRFTDDRWGEECPFASLVCNYKSADYYGYLTEDVLEIILTMHVDVDSWNEDLLNYMWYYGDGSTFRIRFQPTLNDYSTTVTDIIANKQNTIDNLNNTIVQKDNAYNDMVAQKDQAYNDMLNAKGEELALKIAEKDKVIADLNDNIAKNGALRSLFNGIGDGISKIVQPFLGLEFNGITIGSVIAFIVVVIIVFVVLKFII